MDFSLTDDQRLIRDTIRQFMEAEVRPSIRARDREEKFAADELRKHPLYSLEAADGFSKCAALFGVGH